MNLATIRSTFKKALAGLASAESDADIDALLNGAYQYTIPGDIPGEIVEGEWALETVAGTGEYAYPETVFSVKKAAPLIDDKHRLGYYTRPEDFWWIYRRDDSNQRKPAGALFYANQVWLRPIPDDVYTVRIWIRERPAALTAAGIPDRDHALAVAYAAAFEFAADLDHDELMTKLSSRYNRKKSLLYTQSVSARPQQRLNVRSF